MYKYVYTDRDGDTRESKRRNCRPCLRACVRVCVLVSVPLLPCGFPRGSCVYLWWIAVFAIFMQLASCCIICCLWLWRLPSCYSPLSWFAVLLATPPGTLRFLSLLFPFFSFSSFFFRGRLRSSSLSSFIFVFVLFSRCWWNSLLFCVDWLYFSVREGKCLFNYFCLDCISSFILTVTHAQS